MKKVLSVLVLILATTAFSVFAQEASFEVEEGKTYACQELLSLLAEEMDEAGESVVIFDNGIQTISIAAEAFNSASLGFDPASLSNLANQYSSQFCPFAQIIATESGRLELVNPPASELSLQLNSETGKTQVDLSTFTFPVSITITNASGSQIIDTKLLEATRPSETIELQNDGTPKMIVVSSKFKTLKAQIQ